MPAASASARRSLPSYQAPPVGRATEGMTATSASLRTRGADLGDQRRHHVAAPVEEAPQLAVGARCRRARRPRPCRRESRCRWRDRPRCRRATLRLQRRRHRCPRPSRPRDAMVAEAEAELLLEPAVRLHQRELVVDSHGHRAQSPALPARCRRPGSSRSRPARARPHRRAPRAPTGRGCRRSGRRRRCATVASGCAMPSRVLCSSTSQTLTAMRPCSAQLAQHVALARAGCWRPA